MVEITRLFWRKAFTSDGFFLGEIESADVDMATWQVTSFFIGLTDEATHELGFKRPFLGKITVCLPATIIEPIRDTAVLKKTLSELRSLRECKQ